MTRATFAVGITFTLVFGIGVAAGQDDKDKKDKKEQPKEKEILGKTIGEWIKILREHDDPKWRRGSLIALEYGDAAMNTGLSAILNAVEKDKDATVRVDAVKLLGRFDPKVRSPIKALVSTLQNDKDGAVREAAATALGTNKLLQSKQVDDYVNDLAMALKDPHEGTRIAVAGLLRDMNDAAKPAVPMFLEAAANPKENALVRMAAVHVISRHGKESSKTVPLLIEISKNADNTIALRELALDGLGRSGSDATEVVMTLCDALVVKNVELRKAAAVSLGTLGSKAKASWPTVKERLTYAVDKEKTRYIPAEADSAVRNNLIRLAGALGKSTPEVVGILTVIADRDDSTENRIASIQELGELGSAAADAVTTLKRIAAQDGRAAVRDAANKAVKSIGAP